ncbi:MAG: hypothetical protein GY950_16655 [bacterium]|nr:hypothetical protein [bacterium]
MKPITFIVSLFVLVAVFQYGQPVDDGPLDRGFKSFWKGKSPKSRLRAVKKILAANPTFDAVYTRLNAGRVYSAEAKRGRLSGSRMGRGRLRHSYVYYVPESYDPSRRYTVTVYLHGGIMVEVKKPDPWWRFTRKIYKEDRIVVFPISWRQSTWWQYSQVENLYAVLDHLKREYNIDENRVYLFGVSDGATGIYYQALKHSTPWAGFVPVIGSPGVLNNPAAGAEGELFAINMTLKPFLVYNCERDRLYPSRSVIPYVELFRRAGCDIRFHSKPLLGHTALWWDEEEREMETFIREHPRKPFPDILAWETGDTVRFGRAHWLVISRLGKVEGETVLQPWNKLDLGGFRFRKAFVRGGPSGRVELEKKGNTVHARTMGVSKFKLLIAPGHFDFQQPIRVYTNGVEVFSGKLTKDPAVLLTWAARDNDRTMLFGAELIINVRGGVR